MTTPPRMTVPVSKCRSCKADIVWCEHEETRRLSPIDLDPHPDGTVRLLPPREGQTTPRYTIDQSPGIRRRPHFATCPNADHHRKDDKR